MRIIALVLLLASLLNVPLSALAQDEELPWPSWSVVLVGHRGLAPGYPENTLAAYRNNIELGVDMMEIDLRGTKDGEIVILHDDTVDRTTNGEGDVTALTLAEVKELDAGSYVSQEFASERIPTYEEVLKLVKGTDVKLLLDIKESEVLDKERIVRLTEAYGAELDVIVGVRSLDDLAEFRALNPNLRTLGFIPSIVDMDEFAEAGVDILRFWPEWVSADPLIVEEAHRLGKPVWSTSGEAGQEELTDLIKLGVNGFLTDVPEELAALLQQVQQERGTAQ